MAFPVVGLGGCLLADLSSQASIRALAGQVLAKLDRLDVLVNFAGGYRADRHATVDGLELTFALNHPAYFQLTNLPLDLLKASAPARVVRSRPAPRPWAGSTSTTFRAGGTTAGQRAYNQSKLANVLFTHEMARRLAGTGVTATVVHPGVTRTNFGRETPLG